mmetsp:Transcript_66053/g.144016  ORF Transcript_66053/g.144016 Transcript_66053/m.144016 type:complete len:625 (+) Transcript_66053:80-1954(+)
MDWLRGLCRSSASHAARLSEADDPLSYGCLSRGPDFTQLLRAHLSAAPVLHEGPRSSFPGVKAAAWSPSGTLLAFAGPAGVTVADVDVEEVARYELTNQAAQQLQWSPKSTYVLAQCVSKNDEPNVQVWRRVAGGSYRSELSFHRPKNERGQDLVQWSPDERLCCRLLSDGTIHLSTELTRPPVELPVSHAQACRFSPSGTRLALFTSDTRDSMRHVVAPAQVLILELDADANVISQATSSVKFGQQAELLWSPSSTALLAHCQTEVDDSGKSYYGSSKLLLISHTGKYSLDLSATEKEASDVPVQAVSWSPTREEFILVQGFQPAKVTCWAWDESAQRCSLSAVLLEKAHRNTICWNPFGSIVCVAGFGNLAGEMDFFGGGIEGHNKLKQLATCEAACTVSAEWAPDGRHLLTAVLAPRMRVDNGLHIWCALTGTKVLELSFDELHEVQWRPHPERLPTSRDSCAEELERILNESGARAVAVPRRTAYRPPGARNESAGTVAQMMRGEASQHRPEVLDQAPKTERWPVRSTDSGSSARLSANHRPNQIHGDKLPCPAKGWQYKDPKGNIQGPFSLQQMQEWNAMAVFKPDLPMRCSPDDRFVAFRELFPHPMIPFTSCPRRPT